MPGRRGIVSQVLLSVSKICVKTRLSRRIASRLQLGAQDTNRVLSRSHGGSPRCRRRLRVGLRRRASRSRVGHARGQPQASLERNALGKLAARTNSGPGRQPKQAVPAPPPSDLHCPPAERPLEYEVAPSQAQTSLGRLEGGGARSVGRTVRSIASGRSGARVSSWLRGGHWPGSVIWRPPDHRCPGFLGASSAPKRRPPSLFARRVQRESPRSAVPTSRSLWIRPSL